MKNKSLVSIADYTKEDVGEILRFAQLFEQKPNQGILESKVIASPKFPARAVLPILWT